MIYRQRFFQRQPINYFRLVLLLNLAVLQAGLTQSMLPEIKTLGQPIPGISREIEEANQSQVVWYKGFWWGIFRSVDGDWYVYQFENNQWVQNGALGVSGTDFPDAHVDHFNNKLFVLFHVQEKVSRMTFSEGQWSRDAQFPVNITIDVSDQYPACISRANDGDLFIFYDPAFSTGDLFVLHSTDNGLTWQGPFEVSLPNRTITIGLTDAIPFRFNGVDYMGVIVGLNNGAGFYFLKLEDSDDPTVSANWSEETLPFNLELYRSDDHVSLVKDLDQNLYAIVKTGGGLPSVFYLFKRSNSGSWDGKPVNAGGGSSATTRPTLVIDETNGILYILATVQRKIRYVALDKNNIREIGEDEWIVVIENGSDTFNNVTVSYQPLSNGSDIMVCAENTTGGASGIWYNQLDINAIAAIDPLIVNEVNSRSNPNQSYIEIFNRSSSLINLSEYVLEYYDNHASSATATQNLGTGEIGELPAFGYLILARSEADFLNAYNFPPDFVNPDFKLDGGADGIALLRNTPGKASTVVDRFNYARGTLITWANEQLFERMNYPNDGRNLYFDYLNSSSPAPGTPGGENDTPLPVFLAFFQGYGQSDRIVLEWKTFSELNNLEWIIFRREEGGGAYRELARLPGGGTTSTGATYQYIDKTVETRKVYYYRLANVDFSGQVNHYPLEIKSSLNLPKRFILYANYPNPFNPETNIRFEVGEAAPVTVNIYDISGRLVRRLVAEVLPAGDYHYLWDGRNDRGERVSSGMYLLNFITPTYQQAVKMVLSR